MYIEFLIIIIFLLASSFVTFVQHSPGRHLRNVHD
uniref:Uncharacterized protein n=1 Tax=Anguilla anguilla TaxID=7936 RepID=A0A0E9XXB5_ANGAN